MTRLLCTFSLLALASPVSAGVFHLSNTSFFDPFTVVHPMGYDGTGGPIEVAICVSPDSETTRPALESAVDLWNGMTPTTANCSAFRLVEEGSAGSDEPRSMATVMLHELGHCALGLDHINWQSPDPQVGPTSFTNTKEAAMISVGADGIRGSFDDRPTPLPGSRVLHWFRMTDNNPFVVSGVVDISTFSRRIVDLPAGHQWPASANSAVGLSLGFANTQSVMYSHIDAGQSYSGLTADDVDTIRFAMSGADEMAGTGDDYTVSFNVIKPFFDNPRGIVEINRSRVFDVIHASGFESGGTLDWPL